MNKIIWLCSWYPNKSEPLTGDFIERHALAASAFNKISVLHVYRDIHETPGTISAEKRTYNSNADAVIIGYNCMHVPGLTKIISAYKFARIQLGWIRQYFLEKGKPDLIHLHVTTRVAFIALYLKWRYKIPFVITEHSTTFLEDAKPNFDEEGTFTKKMCKAAMRTAVAVSTVSHHLGKSLQKRFGIKQYTVIPNVVNTDLFFPKENHNSRFVFIHVSTLQYQKNPEQIIEAIHLLRRNSDNFELIIYGPENMQLHNLVRKYELERFVHFRSEVPQYQLAEAVRSSDALVLYSRYETFGCVVIEAMASGIPVVVSDIPVLHEIVNDQNGMLVELNNPELLAEKLLLMMQNKNHYDRLQIANATRNEFGFDVVGRMFTDWYKSLIKG